MEWMDGQTDRRTDGRTDAVAAGRLDDDEGGLATSETGEGEDLYPDSARPGALG